MRAEQDLIDNGPRSTRRTKLICTIGPASSSKEMLATLAGNGMNVARLNMCHGSQESHRRTIQNIRQLNKDKGCSSSAGIRVAAPARPCATRQKAFLPAGIGRCQCASGWPDTRGYRTALQ